MKNDYLYIPKIGESCLISPPNADDENGYIYFETTIQWEDEIFILTKVDDCWPIVYKKDHCNFKKLKIV